MAFPKALVNSILADEDAYLYHVSAYAKSGDLHEMTPYFPDDLQSLFCIDPRFDICCSALPM